MPLELGGSSVGGCRTVALFVSDPDEAPQLSEERIRKLLGLTRAEAHVAAQLAAGACTQEIADRAGVQVNTVRCQLKQIYAKTETRSQADLIRLILTGPSVLDPH
jgi:DNA-binding CsgD family transcriptional regulator